MGVKYGGMINIPQGGFKTMKRDLANKVAAVVGASLGIFSKVTIDDYQTEGNTSHQQIKITDAVLGSDGYFVLGEIGNNGFVAKYDTTGENIWAKMTSRGDLLGITVKDGVVMVTGDGRMTVSSDDDAMTYGLSATDGTLLWKYWGGLGGTHEFSRGNAIDDSGDLYTVGHNSTYGAYIVKQNVSDGTVAWSKTFKNPTGSYRLYKAKYMNGKVFAVGNFSNTGILTVWNTDGTLDRASGINAQGSSGSIIYWGMHVDTDGTAYAVGRDTNGSVSNSNYGLITKINPDGTGWSKYVGTDSILHGVTTDSAGNIIVAGIKNYGDTYTSFIGVVIKFDSDGNKIWAKDFQLDNKGTYLYAAFTSNDVPYIFGYGLRTGVPNDRFHGIMMAFDDTTVNTLADSDIAIVNGNGAGLTTVLDTKIENNLVNIGLADRNPAELLTYDRIVVTSDI